MLENGAGRCALEIGPLNRQVFGAFLRGRGWRYVSIDKSRRGNPNDPRAVDFVDFEADATELTQIADASAELVIVQHVIEEIPDYERALDQIARVLGPAGTALLEIPFDPSRGESLEHAPDNFGNVWAFGQDLIAILREHFGQVRVDAYLEANASGHILACTASDAAPVRKPSSRSSALSKETTGSVARENELPGDDSWWAPAAPPGAIEGYPSQSSVRPGGYLRLHVSTNPPQRYRITVYRLGWYGGAGARVMGSYPGSRSDVQGTPRHAPHLSPGPRVEPSRWPATDSVYVGDDWTSGVYAARLELTTGQRAGECSYVPFVIRCTSAAPTAILVQQPVASAQAYNNYGGKSLFPDSSTDHVAALKVSLERPLPVQSVANPSARWPFEWDYQLLRFFEREGFDVAYTTDIDTHREPWSLLGHRLVVLSGHSVCCTASIRGALEFAVSEGTNLACVGANTSSREILFEDEYRAIVNGPRFARDQKREEALRPAIALDPRRSESVGVTDSSYDYELTQAGAGHPWIEGTGLTLPAVLEGLVGYAWDGIEPGSDAADSTVLFHGAPPDLPPADCAARQLESGAVVFAAGSVRFSWGLDDWGHEGYADERLQRFMRNALGALTTPP